MKTTVESCGALHKRISVEIPWSVLSGELEKAYRELATKVELKGFRKGRVPLSLLRQRFGRQVTEETVNRLMEESLEAALRQHHIRSVSLPELQKGDFREGQPFSFRATVEVVPEVEIKSLEVSVDLPPVQIDDSRLTAEIEKWRERKAVLVPVEGRDLVAEGDTVIIDYDSFLGSAPVEGGQARNHILTMGSDQALPGFDRQLLGMRVGERRSFEMDFPRGWGPPRLWNKRVRFEVRLQAIKKKELPPLDDEFARDLGLAGVGDLVALRQHLRHQLEKEEEERIKQQARDRIIDQLIEKNPFPLSPTLLERRQETLARELEMYLSEQGIDLYERGLTPREVLEDVRGRAEREVRAGLLLEAVANQQKLEITPPEIDQAVSRMAARSRLSVEKINALYQDAQARERLVSKLRQEKALDYLLSLPNIKKAPEPPAPAGESGEGK